MDTTAMLLTSYRTLTPIFAVDILGVGGLGFGLLLSAPAFGFLAGSVLLLMAGDVRRKGLVVTVSILGYAVALALFAMSTWFLLSLALIALVGAMDGISSIVRQTALQLVVPDQIRGRATAVLHVFAMGSPSAGQMVTGSLAAAMGAMGALLVGSAGVVVAVLALVAKWREVAAYRG